MESNELKDALRKLRRPRAPEVDLSPASTFDALLDQAPRTPERERHVEELKTRINGLVFLVIGAVVAQIVLSFWGYEVRL